ncbi:MAG: serine protein kinase PrkA [Oligoflexia bacterium]|nr:serine protein kinase PrkA [Oligoflexia bacterium]
MPNGSDLPGSEILKTIDQAIRKEFESNRRVLAFDEYMILVGENAERQTRGSSQYLADMMDHFGTYETEGNPHSEKRFKLFDFPVDGYAPKVVGQEQVQNQIYRALKTFSRQHFNNKLILLHGPNGSAKSSLIHAIMGGLERYCHEPDGALYTFNWVFPVERYTKGGIGLNVYAPAQKEPIHTYAKLPDEEVAARIPCDLKDHPLLIVPQEQRLAFLEKLLGEKAARELWEHMPIYLTRGDLCHRCKQVFDALLTANQGDYKKVLMHVQVERFYLARRYRKGLVTIEPQLHVDAQYHQLTYNRSMSALPASLQSLNLFALTGDLIDGNRGVIEYSDLLKRPVDSFKYLLTACESGSVNISSSIAYLDSVMLGSANEVQLDAFKEFPDFTSFKARIELIRVPYLMATHEEEEIYSGQIQQYAGDKHVAPHAAWTAALWAVLTRLKKPNSINFAPAISAIVSNLSPLEKARLYDNGDMPAALAPEDRKILRAALRRIRDEYSNVPYYEGRMGASAREMKSMLYDAAQSPEFPCLSPLGILRQAEEFVKRVSEYEFLKQDVKDGFHDAPEFVNTVRNEYLNRLDREVRDAMGLYNSMQWEDFLRRYIQHISLVLKKEKIKNPITGKLEDPDFSLIDEFEKIVGAPDEASARETFRQNIISQIGAWSLDHPKESVVFAQIFPDFWRRLEKHYYESQKSVLTQLHDALLVYGSDRDDPNSEGGKLARQTLANLQQKHGYCENCAKEAIFFLMRQRY